LANAIQESLKPELPLRNNYGNVFPPLPWERDLKSVHMESRHFRNDLYASLFQQSGSVETEGQSSSVAHIQSVTTHHLNTDPDAEQQGFLRATVKSVIGTLNKLVKLYAERMNSVFSDIHLQLQDAVVSGGVPTTGKHQLRSRRGHHNGTTNTDTLGTVVPWHQKLLSHQQKCYDTRIAMAPHSDDDDDGNIEDNEQLANAIQESLKPELPPRNNYGNVFPPLPWSDSVGQHWEKRLCWIEHSAVRLTSRERDLKSAPMESRHFRNDLYASLFQQSGSVETEDAEQQGFLRATASSTCQITSSNNRKHRSVSRHISLTSQRLDGGANKNVKRRTTFNCCGISNPHTINNELPESSFALLGNTRSIHEELPESSYARSPHMLSLHFN
ncbi:hypothetical protein Tco_1096058, partial [Tanacetum coccineum]